jgi:glycosyltransferase involved in cell wall biosynthesis
MKLTLAICAYNAQDRIGMVLESLGRQRVGPGTTWELIVVDNASTDSTAAVTTSLAEQYQLPLRLLIEQESGLANARRCAALAARSDLLSYLDDDVVVPENWVEECIRFLRSKPQCGIMGCKVVPLFEDESRKPPDFDHWYAGVLSMSDLGAYERLLDVRREPKVVGAGMSGRTSVFRTTFADLTSLTVGRKGSSLAGGEDLESQLIAYRMGWEIWYNPALTLEHFVPNRKLNRTYLEKWFVDTAACHAWLDCLASFDRSPTAMSLIAKTWCRMPIAARMALLSVAPWRDKDRRHEGAVWARQARAVLYGYVKLLFRMQEIRHVYETIDDHKQFGLTSACSTQVLSE